MNSFQSIVENLSPIGVYSLREGTNNYAELKAYSAGLELGKSMIEEFFREAFYSTAETYGVSEAESVVGRQRENLSVDLRRDMLISRNLISSCDFTMSGVKRIFEALGISGRIEERPSSGNILIYVGDDGFTQGEKNFIRSQLRDLLAADIEVEVLFSEMTWQTLEEMASTFGEADEKRYTWEYIDSM